jgi:hypothetical protein
LSASHECHTADRAEHALHSKLNTDEEIFHALHY